MINSAQSALRQGGLSRAEARELITMPETQLFAAATVLREHDFGHDVAGCCIIHAESGARNLTC